MDELVQIVSPYLVRRLSDRQAPNLIASNTPSKLIRLLCTLGARSRNTTAEYENLWLARDWSWYSCETNTKASINWGNDCYLARPSVLKRAHLHVLHGLICKIRPRHVLEVGCGMGVNLAILCRAFPNILFAGVELSASGSERAKSTVADLPEELCDFAPFDLVGQPQNLPYIYQASAASMPIEDESFDLVFTMQALEQMESIRPRALEEIRRVCASHACFFEAFRDFNRGGYALNMLSRGYFRGSLADLQNLGFRVEELRRDLPTKTTMNVIGVLATL